jgi:hypothetical protein
VNQGDEGPEKAGDAAGAGTDDVEPVGSVGEEAAKLLSALSDWAMEQGADYAGDAAGAAGGFAAAVRDIGAHVATGSEDCRFCPVCQVIHVFRQTSPEVRGHLSVAASSLLHAATGLLSTNIGQHEKTSSVEKIDLDTGADWDEDQ